jgi:sulfite oxidase
MNIEKIKLRDEGKVARRSFVKALSTAIGANIVFANLVPKGFLPVALAKTAEPFSIPGKPGLTILNDRPVNAETSAHLLNDAITPASRLFVRNNGLPPQMF